MPFNSDFSLLPNQVWHVSQACRQLKCGGVIAYPTDTIWGLGCDPKNPASLKRLIDIKQRPLDKGVILLATRWSQVSDWLESSVEAHQAQLTSAQQKPTTWLLPANTHAPDLVKGRHNTIAIRFTQHPLISQLCQQFSGPIVSTSANLHGRSPCRSLLQVRRIFGRLVDYILPGMTGGSQPSVIQHFMNQEIIRDTL